MSEKPKLVYSLTCRDITPDASREGCFSASDINLTFVGQGPCAVTVVNGWEGVPSAEVRQNVKVFAPNRALLHSTDPITLTLSAYGYGVAYDVLRFKATESGHYEIAVYLEGDPIHRYSIHIGP
jgi:hypothetical protein